MASPSIPISVKMQNGCFFYFKKVLPFSQCSSAKLIQAGKKIAVIGKDVIKPMEPIVKQAQVIIHLSNNHLVTPVGSQTKRLLQSSHVLLLIPSVSQFGTICLKRWEKKILQSKINNWRSQLLKNVSEEERIELNTKIQNALKEMKKHYSKVHFLHLFASIADLTNSVISVSKKFNVFFPLLASVIVEAVAASVQLFTRVMELVDAIRTNKCKKVLLIIIADISIYILKVAKPIVLFSLALAGCSPHVLLVFALLSCVIELLRCIKESISLATESYITGTMKAALALKWMAWVFSLLIGVTGIFNALSFFDSSLDNSLLVMNIVLFLIYIPILVLHFHNQEQKKLLL